jgi:hypothetical protein
MDRASRHPRLQYFFHAVSHTHTGPRASRTSPALRRWGGSNICPASAEKRRYRGKAAEGEERDTTPDLLLKHSDATLAIYMSRQMKHLKHASENTYKNT